jgi:hypothetical protein
MNGSDVTSLSLFQDDPLRRLLDSLHLSRRGRIRYSIVLPIVVVLFYLLLEMSSLNKLTSFSTAAEAIENRVKEIMRVRKGLPSQA